MHRLVARSRAKHGESVPRLQYFGGEYLDVYHCEYRHVNESYRNSSGYRKCLCVGYRGACRHKLSRRHEWQQSDDHSCGCKHLGGYSYWSCEEQGPCSSQNLCPNLETEAHRCRIISGWSFLSIFLFLPRPNSFLQCEILVSLNQRMY